MWRIDALVVLVLALMLAGARAFARKLLVEKLWGKDGLAENRLLFLADWAVAPVAIVDERRMWLVGDFDEAHNMGGHHVRSARAAQR